jgi:hypothetical protein
MKARSSAGFSLLLAAVILLGAPGVLAAWLPNAAPAHECCPLKFAPAANCCLKPGIPPLPAALAGPVPPAIGAPPVETAAFAGPLRRDAPVAFDAQFVSPRRFLKLHQLLI